MINDPAIAALLNRTELPHIKWMSLVELLRQANAGPDTYMDLWQRCFADWETSRLGPAPLWWPGKEEVADSNLAGWIRDRGFTDYRAFHEWSKKNREEFWREAIARLGIIFEHPPTGIASDLNRVENPEWLPGARLNIAASCFHNDHSQTAIVFGQLNSSDNLELKAWTYGELLERVRRVAASIRGAGFVPGDAIAVVLPMTAESVAIYLGIVWAGCAVVSIADSFAAREIENRLRIAQAKAVFTYDVMSRGGKTLPLYERVVEATQLPVIVLSANDQIEIGLREQDLAWNQFLTRDGEVEPDPELADPSDAINILFSSGTTGDPKAIPWTHTTPIKCAIDGYCHQDIRPGHVTCWPTNLGWMMGPYLIFATLINRGTMALYGDAPVGPGFGRFVQDARVNMLGVIPTIVKNWRSTRDMEAFDWSAIHVFSSTGESSQPNDMFYLSALAGMRPIIEYCGGTEIGGGYITSTVLEPNVASAFSTPAVGLDFVLVDDRGNAAREGEVFLVPPSIGLSTSLLNRDHHETYFEGTPRHRGYRALRRHGDFMTRLPGDYWVAGGRVDDTMNLGGIKVSSAELERVMNQVDGVRETAAVAVTQEHGPEELHVFAVCHHRRAEEELLKDFNARLRSELNPLFRARAVHVVDSLPRTASNKVMRRELRDSLMARKPKT
jgi:acetyl-CoA synthetase